MTVIRGWVYFLKQCFFLYVFHLVLLKWVDGDRYKRVAAAGLHWALCLNQGGDAEREEDDDGEDYIDDDDDNG